MNSDSIFCVPPRELLKLWLVCRCRCYLLTKNNTQRRRWNVRRQSVARVQKSRRGEIWTTTATAREWEVQINISFLYGVRRVVIWVTNETHNWNEGSYCFFNAISCDPLCSCHHHLTSWTVDTNNVCEPQKIVLIIARPRSTFHTQIIWKTTRDASPSRQRVDDPPKPSSEWGKKREIS